MGVKKLYQVCLVVVLAIGCVGLVGMSGAAAAQVTPQEAIAAALGDVQAGPVGTNDFRISDMGGDPGYEALSPDVAYNSTAGEYLVVWQGDDNSGSLTIGEDEIWGQRVDAATGREIGDDFRLSDMGPDGDLLYSALAPAVAYNSADDEYLVVWHGDDTSFGVIGEEFEIWGQRVDGGTGAEIGTNDFRISDMGGSGDASYDGRHAAVTYNTAENEYLVVWSGDDNSFPLVDEEFEIYYQRLEGTTGGSLGTNDARLSDMGGNGNATYNASRPAVTYNGRENEYLVVWQGDDDSLGLVNDEFEIWGQRVDGRTGAEVGTNDFRLSDMGPDGHNIYTANVPAVAWDSVDNQYLVVWHGDDDTSHLIDGEFEIWGQRVAGATGVELGVDTRFSTTGPDGNTSYGAASPDVAYNSVVGEYLVVWHGNDNLALDNRVWRQRVKGDTGAEIGGDVRVEDATEAADAAVAFDATRNELLVVWAGTDDIPYLEPFEIEIFGQRLAGSTGEEVGANDFRLSDMGEDDQYDANVPAVAHNFRDDQYLVVWYGDDNTGSFVAGDDRIWAQRLDGATGAEIGVDMHLSDQPTSHPAQDCRYPAVAYNWRANEFLVVWEADAGDTGLVDNEFEIYGVRLSATGQRLPAPQSARGQALAGSPGGTSVFRISDMGPDGDAAYNAAYAGVAYNSDADEYLVIWQGDDGGALANDELEIYGQRLDAATGSEIGTDFRISDMGPDGNASFDAQASAVAYNPIEEEYLVLWGGDDGGTLADDEFEVYGQRLDGATGAEIGTNDFRISDAGADGDANRQAGFQAVAYNYYWNEYLVVWAADDDAGGLADDEYEVYAQRLDGATGAEVGTNDFRISDAGPDGDATYQAGFAWVIHDNANDEYLVVWHADDNSGALVDQEFEIYGQRLSGAIASEIGENDFRLSDAGPDGSEVYDALGPRVAYNAIDNQALVVWQAEDDRSGMVDGETEIFGQRYAFDYPLHHIYLPMVLRLK